MQKQSAIDRIERILGEIDRLYVDLYKLSGTLENISLDLNDCYPDPNGGVETLADYARALKGAAKLNIALADGILRLIGNAGNE